MFLGCIRLFSFSFMVVCCKCPNTFDYVVTKLVPLPLTISCLTFHRRMLAYWKVKKLSMQHSLLHMIEGYIYVRSAKRHLSFRI